MTKGQYDDWHEWYRNKQRGQLRNLHKIVVYGSLGVLFIEAVGGVTGLIFGTLLLLHTLLATLHFLAYKGVSKAQAFKEFFAGKEQHWNAEPNRPTLADGGDE